MKCIIKQEGRKGPRDESLIKLLESPVTLAAGTSTTNLSSDLIELCERLK